MRINQYGIEQLLHTIKTFGLCFTPDEKALVFLSNETGVLNAFRVPVVGGVQEQLTRSTEHVRHVSISLDGSRLFFTRDKGSQENNHLFVLENGINEKLLTPGDRVQVRFMGWSSDNRSFYCATNERDPKFYDFYKIDAFNYSRKLLYQDTEGFHFCSVSNDERSAAFMKMNSRSDSNIYLYDFESHVMKEVKAHDDEIFLQPCCFSIDSKSLYFLSDEGKEYSYVCRYEIESGRIEEVAQGPYNILQMRFSRQGKYRILLVDCDASTRLIVRDCDSDEDISLAELDDYSVMSFTISDSETMMACFVESDTTPASLITYEFATRKLRKLVGGLKGDLNPKDLVVAKRVRFRSFDRLEIPALLWKPRSANAANRVPALVWVHGGPGGQMRVGYSARIQYLVNHGYAVLGVNHRGSSGYGKTFYCADERRQAREPLWDCVEAKNYLAALDFVESGKIGIIGGSFGGYMVLAALTFQPDEFSVGVAIAGVSNWLRAYDSFPAFWHTAQRKIFCQKVGDPKVDGEMLRAISPFFYAANIVKPLMVVQGAKDPRVLRVESDDMVDAVRQNGGIVEYLVFDDEAHALRRRKNAITASTAILDFLDRHLKAS